MKLKSFVTVLFALLSGSLFGQKLKNGTYTFSIKDVEYVGRPIVATCKVMIKGANIKVIYTDSSLTNIKFGDIFDQGILMWHKKTKQWIIGHSKKDANAKEVGGCSDGPRVIDLKRREILHC